MSANGFVVVSPHLDDAVLSASMQLARPGAKMVTVCTGEPSADAPLAWWDRLTGASSAIDRVRERYVEDDAALGTLGVTASIRLGFPDGQHVTEAERPTHEQLVSALRPHLDAMTEIWAPAGVGAHPDHVAVRDAVMAAVDREAIVHHYADVPYSLRYGWPPSVTGLPALSPFLDVELWLQEQLVEAGLDVGGMTREVRVLDRSEQRRKVRAMACYATQIPGLDYGQALAQGHPAIVGFEVSWSRS